MIGAGRVATALAVAWSGAGYEIAAASGRDGTSRRVEEFLPGTPFYPWERAHEAARSGRVVVLGVPDDLIEDVCTQLADRRAFAPGQFVLHVSGSVGLDALAAARSMRAEVLSLHPLQAFPSVGEGIARLPGSAIAITASTHDAFALGQTLARDAGGRALRLRDDVKPLYHAAAVFCSNYLVAVEGMAEHLFRLAGIAEPLQVLEPLARAAFDATFVLGPAEALTGPAVRGDAGTIARNLEALSEHAPDAVPAYVALARVAATLGVRSGRVTPEESARLDEVLRRWS